jgi:hypothetical protein
LKEIESYSNRETRKATATAAATTMRTKEKGVEENRWKRVRERPVQVEESSE